MFAKPEEFTIDTLARWLNRRRNSGKNLKWSLLWVQSNREILDMEEASKYECKVMQGDASRINKQENPRRFYMAFVDAGKWLLVSLNENCWISWQSNRLPVNLHKQISSTQECWAPCRPLSNNWQDRRSNPARHEMRPDTSRCIAEHEWQPERQSKLPWGQALPWVKAWSCTSSEPHSPSAAPKFTRNCDIGTSETGLWKCRKKRWRLTREDFASAYVAYVCVLMISVQSILEYSIFTWCQGSSAARRSSSTADT